jgi:hypothetical protein
MDTDSVIALCAAILALIIGFAGLILPEAGGGALSQLSDVGLSVLVDGQVLTWNATLGNWTNALGTPGPQGDTGPQGLQGEQGIQGQPGLNGTNGTNGATWFNGTNVPSSELGVNGDFYFRLDNGWVYNKISSTWTYVANLTGLQGATGQQGQTGPQGPAGMGGLTILGAVWDNEATKTNIGTTYIDIYTAGTKNQLVNFTGFTSYRVIYWVLKVGSGTQNWRLYTGSVGFGYVADSAAAAEHTLDTGWVAVGSLSGELSFRPQGNSTVSGDDPVFRGCELLLK